MRKVRLKRVRVLAAVGALFIGGSLVWVPSVAADVTLVDAVASLFVRAQNDVDQTGDVPFDPVFSEEVVADDPPTSTASRGNQDTVLRTGGAFLAAIETSAFIEASARVRPGNEATASAQLRVTFEIDAPTTMQVQGVIAADHSLDGDRCPPTTVDVFAGPSAWQATATCDGGSEVVIDDEIPLATAGTYQVFINTSTSAEPFDDGDSSDGSASWNLNIGLCPNEFTDGNDVIAGTPGDDILCGGRGNDTITGGGGSDVLLGGAGNDEISGGDGSDTIRGEDGQDTISGDLGDDEMVGGEDDRLDILRGCNLDDSLCFADKAALAAAGVSDSDIILAGPGGSFISGLADEDILLGGPGFDQLFGGPASDFIRGRGGRDEVNGELGNDLLSGGGGHDSGTDGSIALGVFGGPGNDTIKGDAGDDLLEGGAGRDEMIGEAGSDKLRGRDGADCLIGGERKDVLVGGEGGDRLLARDGVRDELKGGPQFDRARIDEEVDDVTGVENRNFQGGCP